MASFAGVAGLYILLDAGFLAASQLLVYIGAISILVIFAIMMTRRLMQTTESPYNSQWKWAIAGSLLVFMLLAVLIFQTWPTDQFSAPPPVSEATIRGSVTALGTALVSVEQFVLPFEIASVLLLAALVGAIFVARPEED
jgi:NADH-quinone oxidoreductase subunit J